jgi:hypothetical protein
MHGGGGTVAVSAAVVSDGELVLMVTTASHDRIRIQFTVGGWGGGRTKKGHVAARERVARPVGRFLGKKI